MSKQSPLATAALSLLAATPELVVQLIAPQVTKDSVDEPLLAAVAVALAKTGDAPAAKGLFARLFALRPTDVEVAVCLAEAAMAAADPATAVSALEKAFALDAQADTPAGRRARVLAFKLEKQLGSA